MAFDSSLEMLEWNFLCLRLFSRVKVSCTCIVIGTGKSGGLRMVAVLLARKDDLLIKEMVGLPSRTAW